MKCANTFVWVLYIYILYGMDIFCRGVHILLRSSNLIVDSSFHTYMPIFISLRLGSSSINSDKQTTKMSFRETDSAAPLSDS